MGNQMTCPPVSPCYSKIDRHLHKTDSKPCLGCSVLKEGKGISALYLAAMEDIISRYFDNNSIDPIAHFLQDSSEILVQGTMDPTQYVLPRLRRLVKCLVSIDSTGFLSQIDRDSLFSETLKSKDISSVNKNLAFFYDEMCTVFTQLRTEMESRIRHDVTNRKSWEKEISQLLLKALVSSQVFVLLCMSACDHIIQEETHEYPRQSAVELVVLIVLAVRKIEQQPVVNGQIFGTKESLLDIAKYVKFKEGIGFHGLHLNKEVSREEQRYVYFKAKLDKHVDSERDQIHDLLLALDNHDPLRTQGNIIRHLFETGLPKNIHVNIPDRLGTAMYNFDTIISVGQIQCISLPRYAAMDETHREKMIIDHEVPTQECESESTGTTDSNEAEDSLQDGIKMPRKNSLNSDLPACDAVPADPLSGSETPRLLRTKDHHPLAVGSNPPTAYPEKLEDSCERDKPPVLEKFSTVFDPKEDGISMEHPAAPHDNLSGKFAEPSPTSKHTPPGDSSLRLGKKCLDESIHDATEVDRPILTESDIHLGKGTEHLQAEDLFEKADEEPVATDTTDDRAIEEAGTNYAEEGDSAEEDFGTLSVLKGEMLQTHPPQDSLEGRTYLDAVSLRDSYGKPNGEYEPQQNPPRISAVEDTAREMSLAGTTQDEELAALEPVEYFDEEFWTVSELKREDPSEHRRHTGENPPPELSQQSHSEEVTPALSLLFIKEGITMTFRLSSPEPAVQRIHGEDKQTIFELEILLEELEISHPPASVNFSELGPHLGSVIADEDYVSLAESKGIVSSLRSFTAESRTISTAETSRETVRLELLPHAKPAFDPFLHHPSLCELLQRHFLSIPFFPNMQNGLLRVDFRSPTREPMFVESFRLCTFLYCPNADALPAVRLANAGFYYTGSDGVVACYSCDLRCRHNDARLQGDPYAFHREMNRDCPHLNNTNPGHLFIQDHQTSAHSGMAITGSPSEGWRSVPEMIEATKEGMNQMQAALRNVNSGISATGGAAHSSAAEAPPQGTTSTSAGTESPRSPHRGPHSVSSSNSNNEGAQNAAATSTSTTTANNNPANNNTERQDYPASSHPPHPPGIEAATRTTSRQTASSTASQQVSNTSLLNSSRGQPASGARGASNNNRSAAYETNERRSADISFSSGFVTSQNLRTERPPQEDLDSRQTSSRQSIAAVPTVLTIEQRAHAPTTSNDVPMTRNDSRPSRPQQGLLEGSPAHGDPRVVTGVFSAINSVPSVGNHTTQRGEAPPTPRQAETVTPPNATPPAPSAPPFDPSGAVHRQYIAREARERSFHDRWPDTHAQSPEELAEVGFFYAGSEDCVRCHYCGLGLKHWDPDDRPLDEHIRWRPSCAYLHYLVGEEEIDRTLARIGRRPNGSSGQPAAGIPAATAPRRSVANGNPHQMTSPDLRAETEQFMTSEVVRPAREMGFSDDSIRRGIGALLQTSAGRRAVTSQNLVHTILFLRERGRDLDSPTLNNTPNVVDVSSDDSDDETNPLPSNDSQANQRANARASAAGSGSGASAAFPANRDGLVCFVQRDQDGSHGNVGQQPGSPDTPSSSQPQQAQARADASDNAGDAGPQTIRQLEQENQELRERRRCKICLDNDVNILFLPCGHLVCCAECAPALRRCPICRRRVSGTISIQFAGIPNGQQQ